MRRFFTLAPALLVLLTASVVLFAGPSVLLSINSANIAASMSLAQARLDAGTELERVNEENRAVVEAVMPGVVHVDVRYRGGSGSTGAGWLWDDQGHVITNAHVVQNSRLINVQLYDGRVERATVVGTDRYTDIAVLKISDERGLHPARRGSTTPLHIGDQVFVVGSPFNIRFSASKGVVSGLGRSEAAPMLGMLNGYTNYIQTDAAMNPGNSGGPVADVNGRIIGMASAIANQTDRSGFRSGDLDDIEDDNVRAILRDIINDMNSPVKGQSAGIGFAIPMETLESVVPQLIEDEIIIRGYVGVELSRASRFSRDFNGQGVIISAIPDGQPASRSDLRPGDIVVAVDGRQTPDFDVFRSAVSVRKPGEPVTMRIWRDGDEIDISVTLGGAYMNDRNALVYIPRSESMTMDEVQAWVHREGDAEEREN